MLKRLNLGVKNNKDFAKRQKKLQDWFTNRLKLRKYDNKYSRKNELKRRKLNRDVWKRKDSLLNLLKQLKKRELRKRLSLLKLTQKNSDELRKS